MRLLVLDIVHDFKDRPDNKMQNVLSVVHMCFLYLLELFTAQEMQLTRFSMRSLYLTSFGFTFY